MDDYEIDLLRKVMSAWHACFADKNVHLKSALAGGPVDVDSIMPRASKQLVEALEEPLKLRAPSVVRVGIWMAKRYGVEVDGRTFLRVGKKNRIGVWVRLAALS